MHICSCLVHRESHQVRRYRLSRRPEISGCTHRCRAYELLERTSRSYLPVPDQGSCCHRREQRWHQPARWPARLAMTHYRRSLPEASLATIHWKPAVSLLSSSGWSSLSLVARWWSLSPAHLALWGVRSSEPERSSLVPWS